MGIDPAKELFIIRGGGRVVRSHTYETVRARTVGFHSWGVAILCDILTGHHPSAKLLRHALHHDVAEGITGDVPATAKWRFPPLSLGMRFAEYKIARQHTWLSSETDLSNSDLYVFKWADMLDFLLECYDEHLLGNRNVEACFLRGMEYLKTLPPNPIGEQLLKSITAAWYSPVSAYDWESEYPDSPSLPTVLKDSYGPTHRPRPAVAGETPSGVRDDPGHGSDCVHAEALQGGQRDVPCDDAMEPPVCGVDVQQAGDGWTQV